LKKKRGLEALGAFILLVEMWANQRRERRQGGIIWSYADTSAADSQELAYKLRIAKPKLDKSLDLLIDIGWISIYNGFPTEIPCISTGNPALDKTRQDKTEQSNPSKSESVSGNPVGGTDDDTPF